MSKSCNYHYGLVFKILVSVFTDCTSPKPMPTEVSFLCAGLRVKIVNAQYGTRWQPFRGDMDPAPKPGSRDPTALPPATEFWEDKQGKDQDDHSGSSRQQLLTKN